MQLDLNKIPQEEKNDAILMFETRGRSNHSKEGLTALAVIEHCVENNIPFTLTGYPGLGYVVEKIEEEN